MSRIIEAAELPEEDKVYLKKDIFGWRTVYPITIDGKINLVNLLFGGYRNLILLVLIFSLAGFNMWSYNHDVQAIQNNYANISADPIGWCKNVNLNRNSAYAVPKIDFSQINITTTTEDND